MPIYSYICDRCDNTEEVSRSIHADEVLPTCDCGAVMRRDFGADVPTQSHQGREYSKPIISDSLAVSPSQVAEHRRLFPDIKIHDDGRPEFTNYAAHDAYLKKTGFRKQKQRVRHKFRKAAV